MSISEDEQVLFRESVVRAEYSAFEYQNICSTAGIVLIQCTIVIARGSRTVDHYCRSVKSPVTVQPTALCGRR
jgi:hypothetical protein